MAENSHNQGVKSARKGYTDAGRRMTRDKFVDFVAKR